MYYSPSFPTVKVKLPFSLAILNIGYRRVQVLLTATWTRPSLVDHPVVFELHFVGNSNLTISVIQSPMFGIMQDCLRTLRSIMEDMRPALIPSPLQRLRGQRRGHLGDALASHLSIHLALVQAFDPLLCSQPCRTALSKHAITSGGTQDPPRGSRRESKN